MMMMMAMNDLFVRPVVLFYVPCSDYIIYCVLAVMLHSLSPHSLLPLCPCPCACSALFCSPQKLLGWMCVMRFVVSGLLLGAMSFSAGDDAGEDEGDDFYNEDSFGIASTLFAIVLINVLGLGLSVPFIHSHFRLLKTEIAAGIYNPLSAWCALVVHEVPLQVAGSLFLALVVRMCLQLEDNAGAYYWAVCLCALCAASLAAVVAGVSPSGYRAAQAYMTCASLICLFCGYLRPIPDMPTVFQWLTDFSFGRWAFELLMLSVFQDTATGDSFLDSYGFKNQSMHGCVFWMFVWILVLQIVVIIWLFPFPYKSVYSRLDQLMTKTPAEPVSTSHSNPLHLLDKSSISAGEGSYMDVTQHRSSLGDTPTLPPQVVSLPETKKTSLSFEDVGFALNVQEEESKSHYHFMTSSRALRREEQAEGDTVVLKGITGSVKPGQLCCILDGQSGEAGAGEILLQVLAGRATGYGKVSGEICVSDKTLMQGDFVHNSVMVLRGDSKSHSLLTVRETLEFSALLRRTDQRSCPMVIHLFLRWRQASLWRKIRVQAQGRRQTAADDFIEFNDEEVIATTGQVQEKVDEILRVFDLEDVADVTIGHSAHNRNISPSQMRLVTIATEALNRPGLLYLQDPFHGLDWYHASRVCRVLKAVVAGGRAVICSLPHPTDDIFSMFDSVVLINRGLLLYHGATSEASHHFRNIGFEPKEEQSDLAFLSDICEEKAQMGMSLSTSSSDGRVSSTGRKSSLLTTEDLVNIRISMSHSHSTDNFSSLSPSTSVDTLVSHLQAGGGNPHCIYQPMMGPVIRRSDASVGPATRVIATRRSLTAYRNRHRVWFYFSCSLLFGLVLGGMWFNLDDGDIHGRVLVSAVAYLYMTASLAGLLNGTHRRQDDYLRERDSGAATGTSYWLGDGVPVVLHTAPNVVLFTVPLYLLAGMRTGFASLGYYCVLFVLAVYCNVGLMYLVTGVTKDALMSRVVFLGALLPLQLLFSGAIVYLSAMYDWLRVFAYLNPMQYFLAGMFTNEFHDNAAARGDTGLSYGDVKEKYGFKGNLTTCLIALFLIANLYRILWLFSLKYREIYAKRHVLKKVMVNAHSRVSSFVSTTGMRLTSVGGGGGKRSSRSRGASRGGYFNADELDQIEDVIHEEEDGDDDDSDQLSSRHSISEFVLSPYNLDEDSDGISLEMEDMGGSMRSSFDRPGEGGGGLNLTPQQQSFRRELPPSQSQVTPPSRQGGGGHNRIIIVPKSGGGGGGGKATTTPDAGPDQSPY